MRSYAIAASTFVFSLTLVAAVVWFFLWSPGTETGPGIDKAYYERRLAELAGPAAVACPEFSIGPVRRDPMSPCLRTAIDSGAPFRISRSHELGNIGIARDAAGRIWSLDYDRDVTCGWSPTPKPRLITHACRNLDKRSGFCSDGR
ncbi:hypothetical protein GCM10027430_26940 [Lysobacter tyrosinilyticus]